MPTWVGTGKGLVVGVVVVGLVVVVVVGLVVVVVGLVVVGVAGVVVETMPGALRPVVLPVPAIEIVPAAVLAR